MTVPALDAGFAGDYLSDGGCVPTPDGGARCHPWCTPDRGDAGKGAGTSCCLDDECASGECQGSIAAGNRVCVVGAAALNLGAACGDPTDCNRNSPVFCDVRSQRCTSTIVSTLGRDGGLLTTFLSSGGQNGSLLPSTNGFFCALPGVTLLLDNGGSPCCYDRTDAGTAVSCLETGTCACSGMDCSITRDHTCPF